MTEDETKELQKLRLAWRREDQQRAQKKGVVNDPTGRWLGFKTVGPATLADLVLFNPTRWVDRRDRAWVLLQSQTGASWSRLSLMTCADVISSSAPCVHIHSRDDPEAPKRPFSISPEVAHAIRELISSVVAEQTPEAKLFQSCSKKPDKIWSGQPLPQASWSPAITRVMIRAAEASPLRTASMATVQDFALRLTPRSVLSGLIADCIGKGFELPVISNFLGDDYIDRVNKVAREVQKRRTLQN